MFDPVIFTQSLNSYFNLAQAALRNTNQLTAQEMVSIIGTTPEIARYRSRNPLLWRISEIKLVADYCHLSSRVCEQMYSLTPCLLKYLQQLPVGERKQVERLCQVKMTLLINRSNYDLPIADLYKIYKGLLQLK
jgi:hypothetical protein